MSNSPMMVRGTCRGSMGPVVDVAGVAGQGVLEVDCTVSNRPMMVRDTSAVGAGVVVEDVDVIIGLA